MPRHGGNTGGRSKSRKKGKGSMQGGTQTKVNANGHGRRKPRG